MGFQPQSLRLADHRASNAFPLLYLLNVNHRPLPSARLLSVQNSRWLLACPSHDPSCTAPGCLLLAHSEGKKDVQKALPTVADRIQGETPILFPLLAVAAVAPASSIASGLSLSRNKCFSELPTKTEHPLGHLTEERSHI